MNVWISPNGSGRYGQPSSSAWSTFFWIQQLVKFVAGLAGNSTTMLHVEARTLSIWKNGWLLNPSPSLLQGVVKRPRGGQ